MTVTQDSNLLLYEIFIEVVNKADRFFFPEEIKVLNQYQEIIWNFICDVQNFSSRFCSPDLYNLVKKVEKEGERLLDIDLIDVIFNVIYSMRTGIHYIHSIERENPGHLQLLVKEFQETGKFDWIIFYSLVRLHDVKDIDVVIYDSLMNVMRPIMSPTVIQKLELPNNRRICIESLSGFGQFRREKATHATLMECFYHQIVNKSLSCTKLAAYFEKYLISLDIYPMEKFLGSRISSVVDATIKDF